jgi:CRP-like cAMP-binding protein
VKGRIAFSLISLKNKFGVATDGAINIILSRQDLAFYAGTTYETVFRILNEFTQEGIITIQHKNIVVLKEDTLHELTKDADL